MYSALLDPFLPSYNPKNEISLFLFKLNPTLLVFLIKFVATHILLLFVEQYNPVCELIAYP